MTQGFNFGWSTTQDELLTDAPQPTPQSNPLFLGKFIATAEGKMKTFVTVTALSQGYYLNNDLVNEG